MLRVLADVALGGSPKRRPENPVCCDPSHYRAKIITPRQRQTCFGCIGQDMAIINANPFLTRWDAACVLNAMTRSYVCGLCFLDKTSVNEIRKAGDCYEHSVYNTQHRCTAHGLRWTECHECAFDVRAGTSICKFCGMRFSAMCKCPRGPLALRAAVASIADPQPEEQVHLKNKLAASALCYAAKLQATRGHLGLVARVKAEHIFPDATGVRSALELYDPSVAERHANARSKRAGRKRKLDC